ncbi:MAG: oligosaccharide repeat unit polymerase [Ignavibacterium sp.]|nr:MAG: oligosaccharide repeat unit polymerase [Ignavibacterium sp.]
MRIINFLAPEFLFFLSFAQAIFPYILWLDQNDAPSYPINITYYPIFVWIVGMISFIAGSMIKSLFYGRDNKINNISAEIAFRNNNWSLLLLIVWFVQTALIIKLYKGVPLVQYLNGSIDVSSVNQLQQKGFVGQFGLYSVTNLLLIANFSFQIFLNKYFMKKFQWKTLLTFLAFSFGILMSGKRQGAFIAFFFIAGSALMFNAMPVAQKQYKDRTLFIIMISAISLLMLIFLFGFLGKIRTFGEITDSALLQIISYLEFPLINFEWQLYSFGINPAERNMLPLLSGFLPYKYLVKGDYYLPFTEIVYGFRYPQPGIGAGIYGPVHLAGGISSIIVFSIVLGYFSKLIYLRARNNWRWNLPYSMMIWPLLSSHSYYHFASLIFFWIPFILIILIIQCHSYKKNLLFK